MKHIKHDAIIFEHVNTSGLNEEYVVGDGAKLTLVILARVTNAMILRPTIRLAGIGSAATIMGAVYGCGTGSIDIKTLQHHQAPNTTSNLLIKCVMTEESSCFYEGTILVDRKAQKTDAYQRNENLLMGERATATSKPTLEILANDVRCTHGALVKTLDVSELWYAATRGIGREEARWMIMNGFLSSTFDGIADTIKREELLWMVLSLSHM